MWGVFSAYSGNHFYFPTECLHGVNNTVEYSVRNNQIFLWRLRRLLSYPSTELISLGRLKLRVNDNFVEIFHHVRRLQFALIFHWEIFNNVNEFHTREICQVTWIWAESTNLMNARVEIARRWENGDDLMFIENSFHFMSTNKQTLRPEL